jgi:hypothetical protein
VRRAVWGGEALLELVARALAALLDVEEVKLWIMVPRRLIERVLDHDLRVLGEVDTDHDPKPSGA